MASKLLPNCCICKKCFNCVPALLQKCFKAASILLQHSSEIASNGLNTNNPETLTLFGDAAAAVILSYDESGKSFFLKGSLN